MKREDFFWFWAQSERKRRVLFKNASRFKETGEYALKTQKFLLFLHGFGRFRRILYFLLNNAALALRLYGGAGLFLGFLQLLFFSNHNLPSLLFEISICKFGLPKPVRSI